LNTNNIIITNNPDFYYIINFTPNLAVECENQNYSTLGTYLGFDKNKYKVEIDNEYTDITQFPKAPYYGYLVSKSSAGVNIDNYIFMAINDFNKNHNGNNIVSQTSNSLNSFDIIGRIAMPVLPDNLLINNNSDDVYKKRDYYGQVKIKQLEVTLLNKYGKPINLFDNNYSFALQFEILYNP